MSWRHVRRETIREIVRLRWQFDNKYKVHTGLSVTMRAKRVGVNEVRFNWTGLNVGRGCACHSVNRDVDPLTPEPRTNLRTHESKGTTSFTVNLT